MKIKQIFSAVLAFAGLVGCNSVVETVPQSAPFVKFSSETYNVEAAASDKSVTISTNCDWTVSSDQTWLVVAPSSGTKATTTLTLSIAENTAEGERSAKLTLSGKNCQTEMKVVQAAPAGPVAPGTEIYTADDFKTFVSVAKDFVAGDVCKVYNDIDMAGATLSPVSSFAATLDGQTHRIYNFKVESSEETTGLFLGNTGTVKNVVFGSKDGSSYDGTSQIAAAEGKGGYHTGLFATNAGKLQNVTTFVKVKFSPLSTSETGVAGLVGYLGAGSSLNGCVNMATVQFSAAPTVKTAIGGVAGLVSEADVVIESCTNAASQELSFPVAKEVAIGGVLARANTAATIKDCHNTADISFSDAGEANGSYAHIGGVAGALYTGCTVSGCENKGTISSSLLQVNRLGGVVGTLNNGGKIENCTNNGAVSLAQAANGNWQAVGGVLGFQEKGSENTLSGCVNNAAVTATVENATTHANKVAVGGVTGIVCLNMTVSGCSNAGAVSVVNKSTGESYAGGIAGSAIKGAGLKFSGNTSSAAVSCKTSDGAGSYAGGIFGKSYTSSPVVEGDKSLAAVSCDDASHGGAIAGCSTGTITGCTVGGSVCGTALSSSNFEKLVQGASSTGTVSGTVFAGGSEEGVGIKSAEDLKAFAEASAAATPDFSKWMEDGTVKVLADIDASSVSPLQITTIPAGVTLDGRGHCIYNFTTVSTAANTGLVLTNAGTIRNIVFGSKDGKTYDGVSSVTAADGKGGRFFGLVAENNGTLDGVTNFATIKFVAPSDAATNGGVGAIAGTLGAASVTKNCVNHASILTEGTLKVETYFGGVAGSMLAESAVFSDCTNEAALTITLPVAKVVMIGGVVGRTNAAVTIENCHNKAELKYAQSAKPSTWMCIGGVVGAAYSGTSVTGCDNTAPVSSDCLQVIRIGGVVAVLNNGGTVSSCNNSGAVNLVQSEQNANWQAAGGIVGFQEKLLSGLEGNFITGCNNKGAVTVSVENATTHANKVAAGGIIGIGCLSLSVSGNSNSGTVKITNKGTGAVYAGGILGSAIKGAGISSSGNVNTGSVSASTSDDANGAAGGIIGLSDMASNTHTGDKSVAAVTCKHAEASGATAGTNKGTLSTCVVGGTVNGTAVTEANLATLVQGSGSTGKAEGTTLAK